MPRGTYHQYRYRAREKARQATIAVQSPEAIRAQIDFDYYCWYVTQDKATPLKPFPHMDVWKNELITKKSNSFLIDIAGQHTDILAPRGGGKSTWLGLWDSWVIGRHATAGIFLPQLFISYTVDVARAKSAVVKQIVDSKRYREVFPMVFPGRKWSDEEWSIDYGFAGIDTTGQDTYTVCCAGLKGSIVSKRAGLILLDDIIKSEDDIENPEVRAKMVRNWENCIEFTLWEGGRAVCLGTRFRGDDIHVTTFVPSKGWRQVEQSALIEDEETGEEKSYCEAMHSLTLLQGERDDKPTAFSFQRQNKVVRISQTSIDPGWIIKGECPEDVTEYDAIALGIDLSSKLKERNDWTVFTLGGRIGNKFYILDIRRGRWMGNISKLNVMLEMCADWGIVDLHRDSVDWREDASFVQGDFTSNGIPLYIYGEDVAYQSSLAGDFTTYVINELGLYDLTYRLSGTQGQDLLVHLRGVSGLFENGLVTWNMYRSLGAAIHEFVNYGSAPHDDCVASGCHLLRGLRGLGQLEMG